MTEEKKEPVIPYSEKIAIGLPRGGDTTFHYEFMESLFKMFGHNPCNYKMLTATKVHHLARNDIFKNFLKTDMNYLLTIDSDMLWEANSLELAYQLIQNEPVDIVTGIYFTKAKPHLPVIRRLDLQAGCYNMFMEWSNQPFEVDGAGMGFMLIPRHVVEKMKPPYCDWKGGIAEDLYFCLKAKKDYGFRIWAHPGIKLGHITKATITSFDWIQQHKPSVEAWVRESMRGTTAALKREYPTWRKDLGIHPMDFKNVNTEKHWDRIYTLEGGRSTWRTYPEKYTHLIKMIGKIYPKDNKFSLLELGAGVGIFASKVKENFPKVEYLGLDISGVAVEELKKVGFKAIKREIPPIDIADPYDLVVGLELLEHLDEKPRLEVIKEISGIIRKEGRAILSVPDNCMPPDDVAEHRIMYNKKSFEKFLKKAFKNVEIESFFTRTSDKFMGREAFLLAVCSNVKGGDKK